jgi:hypothetical protein
MAKTAEENGAAFVVLSSLTNSWTKRQHARLLSQGHSELEATTIVMQAVARETARLALEHLSPEAFMQLCVAQYQAEVKARVSTAAAGDVG